MGLRSNQLCGNNAQREVCVQQDHFYKTFGKCRYKTFFNTDFLSYLVIPAPFLSCTSVPGCQLCSKNKGAVQMAKPAVVDTVDLLIKVQ